MHDVDTTDQIGLPTMGANAVTSPNDVRSLWTGFFLTTVVVVTVLVGTFLISGSNRALIPIAIPIVFTLLIVPLHGLLYTIVATVRLKRGGDHSRNAVRRAFVATVGVAGINLVVASVLTLMAGGGSGWAGLGLLYYLGFWSVGSLLVLPIVDFAAGGRWMPYKTTRRRPAQTKEH